VNSFKKFLKNPSWQGVLGLIIGILALIVAIAQLIVSLSPPNQPQPPPSITPLPTYTLTAPSTATISPTASPTHPSPIPIPTGTLPPGTIRSVPIRGSDDAVFPPSLPAGLPTCSEAINGVTDSLLQAIIHYYKRGQYDEVLACANFIYTLKSPEAVSDQAELIGKSQCNVSPVQSANREDYPALDNVAMSLVITGEIYFARNQCRQAYTAFDEAARNYSCAWVDFDDGNGMQSIGTFAASRRDVVVAQMETSCWLVP
jgi:hypothetical protein